MAAMVLAIGDTPEGRRTYERALIMFKDCLRNDYEMGSFSSVKQSDRINQQQPENMSAIMDALKNGEPLLPRKTHLTRVFRPVPKVPNPALRSAGWEYPNLDYTMKNITAAAELYSLNTPAYRKLWLRNGAFCPFALDCVLPDDYGHGTIWEIMYLKLWRSKTQCDRREDKNPDREKIVVGELMVAIAHLWFRTLRRDIDRGIPLDRCGRDELGLIPHPTIGWLLSPSVGHLRHREPMVVGISNWDPAGGTLCIFDFTKCNICWETAACNFIKWDFNEKFYPVVFSLLPNLRRDPIKRAAFKFPDLPDRKLEDEDLPILYRATLGETSQDNGEQDFITGDIETQGPLPDNTQEDFTPDDIEPAFMALNNPDKYNVNHEILGKHPELFADIVSENLGFVQGFTDIRDYGLDEEGPRLIINEAEGSIHSAMLFTDSKDGEAKPATPLLQLASLVDPPSRGRRTEGLSKRVVLEVTAYGGSSRTSG
ncbi:hypothetical protein H2200_003564 [Cladophialophora chaetospira]|uniref:Uncharacterized protein n=1 Tax=Cladophialophora chaetospira TaxID=386627 RepID=A0AA38XEI2_9EURO|nr:hypothetical protein H2200_003564 [Cladophialophora chaetospira]